MTCSLELVSPVLYQMKQKNHLDIACSFLQRGLHRLKRNHLTKRTGMIIEGQIPILLKYLFYHKEATIIARFPKEDEK